MPLEIEGHRSISRQHGRHLEQEQERRLHFQNEHPSTSKEPPSETNTLDQAKDWHPIDGESDDTYWALLVRSRGDPSPPSRDRPDPNDPEICLVQLRQAHLRTRDLSDADLYQPQPYPPAWLEGQTIRIGDTGNPDLDDHGGKLVYIHDVLEGLIGMTSESHLGMIPPRCEIPPPRVQPAQSVSDNRSGGDGTIAAILQGTIPLVCAECKTTARDRFSGVIQHYAGNPTNRTFRKILCRNCKQDEVDARERQQQALSGKLEDKCKDCGIVFRLEVITKAQRNKAVGKRSCTDCAAKRNPRWRLSASTSGPSTTTQQPEAAPTLYPMPLQTGAPVHRDDLDRHREGDYRGSPPKSRGGRGDHCA